MRHATLSLVMLLGAATTATAQPRTDPDWPCVQRKVTNLSPGQFWNGPDLAQAGEWGDDSAAAQLARKLASRRTEMSEVDGLLDAFAAEAGPDKAQRLARIGALLGEGWADHPRVVDLEVAVGLRRWLGDGTGP